MIIVFEVNGYNKIVLYFLGYHFCAASGLPRRLRTSTTALRTGTCSLRPGACTLRPSTSALRSSTRSCCHLLRQLPPGHSQCACQVCTCARSGSVSALFSLLVNYVMRICKIKLLLKIISSFAPALGLLSTSINSCIEVLVSRQRP